VSLIMSSFDAAIRLAIRGGSRVKGGQPWHLD
jgi:hypothetical protein